MARKRPLLSAPKEATHAGTTTLGIFTPRPANGDADDEAVRRRAYRKWEEAGCPDSDGVTFWLAAEREIRFA